MTVRNMQLNQLSVRMTMLSRNHENWHVRLFECENQMCKIYTVEAD